MRRIIVGIISVALLGLMACSSPGTGSITTPSALTSAGISAPAKAPSFTASPLSDGPSTWSGPTTPATMISTGHPGSLSVTFANSWFLGGSSTLTWADFMTGAQAVCTITNDQDATVLTVDCHDGSIVVHPTVTTVYTFTDKKNPEQSHDQWQVVDVTVSLPTSVNISATWIPDPGYRDDDPNGPSYMYTGTASGSLNNLSVTASSMSRCGMGGGGMYDTFTASMSLSGGHFTGTYDASPTCLMAKGSFDLTQD